MKASVGDRMVIEGHREGEMVRDGEILEVHGEEGAPPFVVRWSDTGHSTLFFPGSDARVQHFDHQQSRHPAERDGNRRSTR
jgi:hypothetical protein